MAIENIGLFPINIDVYKKHTISTVQANDNDMNGRGLLISLVKNGIAFDSTGITLKIGFRNAIGEERIYDCDIVDVVTGKYKVFYPTEMLQGNGGRVVKLEIKAYEVSGALLNYAPMFVYVSASEIPDVALEGLNEFSSLSTALAGVSTLETRFDDVLANATVDSEIINARQGASTLGNNILAVKAQLAETDQRINQIITTPVPAGEIIAQEILDARQGKGSLGSNITDVKNQLIDMAYLPSNFRLIEDTDDTPMINRALANKGKVRIPYRATPYIISTPLLIGSDTTLEVDNNAVIYLANNSNCRMLENINKSTQENLIRQNENIKVLGGIWNGNGDNQTKYIADGGTCTGFLFSGVKNLEFKPEKIYNTQTYAAWFCNVENILIENVEVEIPAPTTAHNQDGLHIQGPSKDITIRNCSLKAHDNVIALNADDVPQGTWSTTGDITDVFIDNIHFNDTHQGMLLLAGSHYIDKVRIQNITGSATYLMMMKGWSLGDNRYGDISVENINIDWKKSGGATYRDYFVAIEGLVKKIKFKNVTIPQGTGEGYQYCFHLIKETSPSTVIETFELEDFESNTVTGEGTTLAPTFVYVTSTVHVKNLKMNKITSEKSTSLTGVYPIQVINSTVDNLSLSNVKVTNAKAGVIFMGGGVAQLIELENINADSISNNLIRMNTTSSAVKITKKNCGRMLIPPYAVANNGTITALLNVINASVIDDHKVVKSVKPINDYWRVGDIVYNSAPTPSGYIGWICTVAGWAYKSLWTASTAYAQGDIIKAGGAVFICKVAGTSGSTMPNTWSGDSTDGSVTWTFLGTAFATFKGYGLIEV